MFNCKRYFVLDVGQIVLDAEDKENNRSIWTTVVGGMAPFYTKLVRQQ